MQGGVWRRSRWVPHLLLILTAIVLVASWTRAREREDEERKLELTLKADRLAARVQLGMKDRTAALDAVRDAWLQVAHEEINFAALTSRAHRRFDDFVAINWVDETGTILWVTPPGPNAAAKGADLSKHPQASVALERARRSGALTSIEQVELFQGGRGIAFYLPAERDGVLLGYVNGVFRSEAMSDALLGPQPAKMSVRLLDGTATIAARGAPPPVGGGTEIRRVVPVADRAWTIVAATPDPPLWGGGWEDEALLGFGLLLAVCFFIAIRVVIRRSDALSSSEQRYRDVAQRASASEAQLLRILEATQDGVLLTDADDKAVFANQRLLDILSLQRSEVLGKDLQDILKGPADATPDLDIRDSGRLSMEKEIEGGDGNRAVVALQTHPIYEEDRGKKTGALTLLTDLSETRTLEAQLRHAQKMEAIGRLAGGIAHDFNNLLMGIMTAAELLEPTVAEDEEGSELVAEISQCGNRAASLTRQLLMFGRKDVAAPRVIDVTEVIDDTRAMLQRLLPENITLRVRVTPETKSVLIDPGLLQQAIVNLAVNAADAMRSGGTLTISTTRSSFTKTAPDRPLNLAPGPHTVIEVTDTGEGIPRENLEKVFDPFFTTKAPGQGTGLGLSSVHGTIAQAGGAISVDSVVGGGTTFTVYLPEADSGLLRARPPEPEPKKLPTSGGRETILVVEDERPVRKVIERALTSAGYDVLVADGPERALELIAAEGNAVSLVVSDVIMPGMNGPAMAAKVKETHPKMRFLFITGYPGDHLPEEIAQDEEQLLSKPFTAAELTRRIRGRLNVSPW